MPNKTLTASLAVVLSLTSLPVLAQASGDGFQGPVTFGDSALDQSLAAMNRELAFTYTRTDVLETVITPDFATMSVIARDVPEPDLDSPAETVAFGAGVTGDGSLDASLAQISEALRDRDAQFFIEVAQAAASKLDETFEDSPELITVFGPQISGDQTLDAKMVHVFDLVGAEKVETIVTDAPVPAFSDATLDEILNAFAAPPTQL